MGASSTPVTLGDVVDLAVGYPFRSAHYVEHDDGVRLLRGDNVAQGQIRWDGVKRWSTSMLTGLDGYALRAGDVVLAMDRPWIEAGLKYGCISSDDLPALLVQRVARLRGTARLDTGFLRYVIGSRAFTEHVLAVQTGTAVPHISGAQIKSFRFLLPSIEQQRDIAGLLGALDDKIGLNRRMNETIEAMARAIFKDWFVDYGPTRAKMEGRPPYLAPDLWALFPERLDDAAKPEGWNMGRLDDLLVLQRGFDLPNDKRRPGPYPVIAASGVNGSHDQFMVRGPGVTTGRSGVLGRVYYVHGDFWPLNTSLWIKEYPRSSPSHAYFLLQGLDFASYNAGSAVPTLNRNHVHSLPHVLPDREVLSAFDRMVLPLLEKQEANEREAESLSQARDLLLPKLMSGEVSVRDAGTMLAAVA